MKTITIIILSVLLTSIATAGILDGLGIIKPPVREFSMDSAKVNTILEKTNAESLSPTISEMTCNSKRCSVWVKQEGIIQTEIFIPRNHCIETQEVQIPKGIMRYEEIVGNETIERVIETYDTKIDCITYEDYSDEELNQMVNDKVAQTLNDYASSIDSDNADQSSVKQSGGDLSVGAGVISNGGGLVRA